MQAVPSMVKKEVVKTRTGTMGIAGDVDYDSDDSVIIVPYVKPTPPVISLEESDGETLSEEPGPGASQSLGTEQVESNSQSPSELENLTLAEQDVAIASPESEKRKKKKKSKTKENNSTLTPQKEKQGKNSKKKKKKGNNKSNVATEIDQDPVPGSDKPSNKKKQKKPKKKSLANGAVVDITPVTPVRSQSEPKETPGKRKKRNTSEGDSSSLSASPTKNRRKKTAGTTGPYLELEEQVLGHAPSIQPRKRKRRKEELNNAEKLRALTPADIDHLNFLKTLNLTGNIGFDETDLLNMALSPADFGPTNLNSLTGPPVSILSTPNCSSGAPTINVSPPKTGEQGSVLLDETSSISSVSSDPPVPIPAPPSLEASPTSTPKPARKKPKDPKDPKESTKAPSFSPGFVSVVEEKTIRGKKKSDLGSVKPVVSVSPSLPPTSKEVVVNSDDETDRIGIFTAEELNQVRSHLQLHITGLGGPAGAGKDPARKVLEKEIASSQEEASSSRNSSRNPSSGSTKASFRYFNPPPPEETDSSSKTSPGKRKNEIEDQGRHRKKRKSAEDSPDVDQLMKPPKPRKVRRDVNCEALMKERAYPSTWNASMIEFYGKVDPQVPDVDEVLAQQSNEPRVWRIPVDMEPYRMRGKQFRCDNCNQYGTHPSYRCPEPVRQKKCVMCGEVGHETDCMYPTLTPQNIDRHNRNSEHSRRIVRSACSSTLCLNCGKSRARSNNKQGDREFVQKCEGCQGAKARCEICKDGRHPTRECPDQWRRFHSVVKDVDVDELQKLIKKPNEPKFKTLYRPKDKSFCCNCAESGHNYYHCREKKGFNSAFSTVKPIIQQELPMSILEQGSGDKGTQPVATTVPAASSTSPSKSQSEVVQSILKEIPQEIRKKIAHSVYLGAAKEIQSAEKVKSPASSSSASASSTKEVQRDSRKETTPQTPLKQAPAVSIPETITIEDDIEIIELDSSEKEQDKAVSKEIPAVSKPLVPNPIVNSSGASAPQKSSATATSSVGSTPSTGTTPSSKSPVAVSRALSEPDVRKTNSDQSRSGSSGPAWRIDTTPRKSEEKRSDAPGGNKKPEDHLRRSKSTGSESFCRDFPDCQNKGPKACLKISLKKSEHKLVLRADQDKKIVEKLNEVYSPQGISICLRKHLPEFHISGDKNYLPRDRILRIVKDLAESRDISKLLPGLQSSSSSKKNANASPAPGNKDRDSGTNKDKSPRGSKESKDPKDNPEASKTTNSQNQADLVQKVVFDPKSLQELESPPSVEEVPTSPITSPAPSGPAKESAPGKDNVSSTSEDPQDKRPTVLSAYQFERKLRKLVCSVPLSSDVPENPMSTQANSKTSDVSSTTDPPSKITKVARAPPARDSSTSNNNNSINSKKPPPKPLMQNAPKDNFRGRNNNRNNNNYNSRFDAPDPSYNQFNNGPPPGNFNFYPPPPNFNYPPPGNWAPGPGPPFPPMGYDIDERTLPFEERQQLPQSQFMNPTSPFYFQQQQQQQPWQNNFGGMYGHGPPPQYQFNNYNNEDFRNDNFNSFDGPQNFGSFFIDRQPSGPPPPIMGSNPPPRRPAPVSFRIRERGRGRGFNSNNRRR